jgi:hypothetical protein
MSFAHNASDAYSLELVWLQWVNVEREVRGEWRQQRQRIEEDHRQLMAHIRRYVEAGVVDDVKARAQQSLREVETQWTVWFQDVRAKHTQEVQGMVRNDQVMQLLKQEVARDVTGTLQISAAITCLLLVWLMFVTIVVVMRN